jgi:hypothetical protein
MDTLCIVVELKNVFTAVNNMDVVSPSRHVSDFYQIWKAFTDFHKSPNIKFHGNPSSGSSADPFVGLRVRIPPDTWMSVSCKCCVFSGTGFGDGPIPRPEESYRLWCHYVCSRSLENEAAMDRVGLLHQRRMTFKNYTFCSSSSGLCSSRILVSSSHLQLRQYIVNTNIF